MSRCFTWFPIGGLGEPNIYHDSGVFYKNVGSYLVGVLQSWIIVQLVSLKKFGSDSQMGYDDGV